MQQVEQIVIRRIREVYDDLTSVEKNIADYFINNTEQEVFSSKNIAAKLFVSEASLSRFAKKCGYKGFREFVYDYEKAVLKRNADGNVAFMASKVLDTYQELLERSYRLVDEEQMERISQLFMGCRRVVVYGKGSSGYAAEELALRLMRIGLYIEAITDSHIMKMNSALLDEEVLVIGLSLSGATPEVVSAVKNAKNNGAKILMMTSNTSEKLKKYCDEVLEIANTKNMDGGTMISPQFPILIMTDILYAYFVNHDFEKKAQKHGVTLSALYNEN